MHTQSVNSSSYTFKYSRIGYSYPAAPSFILEEVILGVMEAV